KNCGLGLFHQTLLKRVGQLVQADVVQGTQMLGQRRIEVFQQPAPARADAAQRRNRVFGATSQNFFAGVLDVVNVDLADRQLALQKGFDFVQQAQLVASG